MKITILFLIILSISCVDERTSPEGVLKDFIEMRLGQKVSREDIVEKLTGKIRQSIENISDAEFEKFSDLKGIKKNSFKILTKSCQKDTCYITYSLNYRNNMNDNNVETAVKKIAEIKNLEGKWFIADISNIKTYHDVIEPIDVVNQ